MDIKKLNIPTLDGPNWGVYIISLQALARILDIWDAMWGEILPTTPPTYNLLAKPTPAAANATAAEIAAYTTAKATWNKNAQGLGLMQPTVSPVIWQEFLHLGTAKELLDALETGFRATGGTSTYLQLGFVMGMGIPMVFVPHVVWVWVWCLKLQPMAIL